MSSKSEEIMKVLLDNLRSMGVFDAEVSVEACGEGRVTGIPGGDTAYVWSGTGPVWQPVVANDSALIMSYERSQPFVTFRDELPEQMILPKGIKAKIVNLKSEGTHHLP